RENSTFASNSVGTPLQVAGRYRQCRTTSRTARSFHSSPPRSTNALCTRPSTPTTKLTITFSSASDESERLGVAKASGGRVFWHLCGADECGIAEKLAL